MAPSSPALSNAIAAPSQPHSPWMRAVTEFLIRRRILLSGILFGLLIGQAVASGSKPHELLNFRDPLSVIGLVCVVAGVSLRSWAVGILRKDRELTTTGPYRWIRNPLYVGSFLMMFGFCALIDNMISYCLILLPVLVIYGVKVRHEERLLATLFPTQWEAYARSTPRFVPLPKWGSLAADWSGTQWMRSREYQALAATILALIGLQVWFAL